MTPRAFVPGVRVRPGKYAGLARGFARPPIATAQSVDLRRYVVIQDQGPTEQCVGEAFATAIHGTNALAGARPSHKGIYTGARMRERASSGAALTDAGCDPQDAVDAMVATGIYAQDAKDADFGAIDDLETWAEATASVLVDPFGIVPLGTTDVAGICAHLAAGHFVAFAMQVDASYMQLAAGQLYAQPSGPSLGGHMQTVCGFDQQGMIVANSWGAGWAEMGFGRIAWTFVQAGGISQVYAITKAPTL